MRDDLRIRANRNLEAMGSDPDSDWCDRMLDDMANQPETLNLSPTELRAINLASHGLGQQEAATAAGVSVQSMKTQRKYACRKLGVKGMTHAVAKALRLGLIQ
jgi:DNA-binding CsgD family transcriptional regulator